MKHRTFYRALPVALLWCAVLASPAMAQEAKTSTDKKTYKRDEPIRLSYMIESKCDDLLTPDFEDFVVVEGPTRNQRFSVIQGKTSAVNTFIYELQAKAPGKLRIPGPRFMIEDKEVRGNSILIEVSEERLTASEKEEIAMRAFAEKEDKPEGSTRLLHTGNRGYMERYSQGKWVFERSLTTEEVRLLKQLEKQ